MARYNVPSRDELPDSTYDKTILPGNEDYVLKVLEITEKTKPDFNGKVRDVFVAKLGVVSFADGAALEDVQGNAVTDDVWLWKDLDPTRMGFRKDGVASMSRQFFLAINGIADLNSKIPQGETEELVGKTVIGTLLVTTGQDGRNKNTITGFKTPGRRRRQPTVEEVSPEFTEALGDLLDGASVSSGEVPDDLPF